MHLKVKNIGMYQDVNINLKDISIITGKNDTGKSTIGKILYSFLSTNYKESLGSIYEELERQTIVRGNKRFSTNIDLKNIDIVSYTKNYIEKEADEKEKKELNYLLNLLKEENKMELIELDIKSKLEMKFSDNIQNINLPDDEFSFNYIDNGDTVSYNSNENIKVEYYEKKSVTDVMLIDFHSDLILNKNRIYFQRQINMMNSDNINDIRKKFHTKDQLSVNVNAQVIKEILDFFSKKNLDIGEYKKGKYLKDGIEIPVNSLASGIKNLLLVKTLLTNGHFKKGTLLILDEPETEFHPEWQVVFGMLIYKISQKLGVKVILNTHSSYFVEIFEKIQEVTENENIGFYQCKKEKDYIASIQEVDNLADIYDDLSSAFTIIDDLKEFNVQ